MKRILTTTIFTLIAMLAMNGCTTHQGSVQAPLKPVAYNSSENNNMANIIFYRAVDMSGALKFSDYTCFIDYNFNHDDEYDTSNIVMFSNRSQYTIKKVTPGIHRFSFINLFDSELSSVVANMEPNKTYYLAITYEAFNPAPTLQFRTKKDFEDNAKDDKQVVVDGKCFPKLDGCYFKEVE